MKRPPSLTARVLTLLLALSGLTAAESPPVLTSGVEVSAGNERTALSRSTRKLASTVDVKVKNTSDRLLEAPVHVVITFAAQNGGDLAGLTVSGLQGGRGAQPYQTFYKDLSVVIGHGLAVGAETTFSFTYERPPEVSVSYALALRGIRNRDPVAATGGPYAGQQGVPLAFDAGGSSDPDGDTLTFGWDFGDGSTAAGATAQHVFEASGLYTVTLTATDARGAVATRETQVPVAPSGVFALARTRTLDGNGHPLGEVTIAQSGPDGSLTFVSDSVSGFASLGGVPGNHSWTFGRSGYLTSYRKSTLLQGQVKVVAFPWLAALNSDRTTLSLLNATLVNSPGGRVVLTVPTGAFEQVQSLAVTELSGQSLPLPLPFGWSPLAAFHLDMAGDPAADIAATVKLMKAVSATQTLVLARVDTAALSWQAESLLTGSAGDTLAVVLRHPGSYAVVLADTLPAGNPAAAQAGQPLPAGTAAAIAADVTAVGSVNPATSAASLDPAKVTAQATVDFTNAGRPLASGAWFLADVAETYDLRDGQALKTPDYDATFYAYQTRGDADPATATATFPMQPRLLFGPDQLNEAHIKVDVLALNPFGGGILSQDGGQLTLDGLQVGVPAGALSGPAAAEIRLLATANLAPFLDGLPALLAFELNLPALADGTALSFVLTQKLAADSEFVLARCVSTPSASGLQPALRLHSDGQGKVTSAEPATGPRLPGITGSGQYVVVQLPDPEALITGLVRNVGATLLAGALVRVSDEPWLSLTGAAGTFAILAKPGQPHVAATDLADGNSGQASPTLADASASANVEIQTVVTGPRAVSTSPADGATKVRTVTPVTVKFSEPLDFTSFGPDALTLTAGTEAVVGSLSMNAAGTEATFLPANPLAASTLHTITLAATLRDRQVRPLEGTAVFTFTTAAPAARGEGAQLVIYEPDAVNIPAGLVLPGYNPAEKLGRVVAVGSAGSAEPEVPVILVNETTGEAATVLSKTDGSFANFVKAAEEDFITAVFVNSNGSRITVPAIRQNFDDGRVGLYKQGGILEAQSDGGPVLVTVKPGSVPRRSIFKISPLDVAKVVSLLDGTEPPEGSQLFGGVRLEVEGDPLNESVKVSIPVERATMRIPAGADPALGVYALTRVTEVNGMKMLEILDKMEFEDGRLHTASPPFLGLDAGSEVIATMISYLVQGGKAVLTGRALARAGGSSGSDAGLPLPGAVVYVDALATESGGAIPPLAAGRFVVVADASGAFRLLTPLPAVNTQAVALGAVSNRFPGAIGNGFASRVGAGSGLLAMTGDVYFDSSRSRVNPLATEVDTSPPTIAVTEPNQASAVPGKPVPIQFIARDDTAVPSLAVTLISVVDAGTGDNLASSHYSFSPGTAASSGLSTFRTASVTVDRPAIVTLHASSTDGRGNPPSDSEWKIFIRASQPARSGTGDTRAPYVLYAEPFDKTLAKRFVPIVIHFNKPIDVSKQRELVQGITLTPSAGTPYVSVSADHRDVSLYMPELKASTVYSIDVSPSFIRDEAGNALDQDKKPDGVLTHFTSIFTTQSDAQASVSSAVEDGAGVVDRNGFFYFVDRGSTGMLRIIRKAPSDATGLLVASVPLLDYPRDVVLAPQTSYRIPTSGGQPEYRAGRDLLVITGGLLGGASDTGFDGLGPWLQVIDVTDPEHPEGLVVKLISDSPAAAFVKLAWTPPILGLLELNPTESAIHYVNLPLFIWACHRLHKAENDPLAGNAGVDIDGDGNYNSLGDVYPSPARAVPAVGLINAGLVASFLPEAGAGRFTDFDIGLHGHFLGVTGVGTDGGGYYSTLISGNDRFTGPDVTHATLSVSGFPKRLLNVFEVPLEIPTGRRTANLALVSTDTRLVVIDVTDALKPTVLTTLDVTQVGGGQGLAESALLRSDNTIALSCSQGMIILDPRRFALPAQLNAAHPAVLGVYAGIGTGARAFVSHKSEFAVSQGSRSILSAGDIATPVKVTGIFAEDINDAATRPDFPPANFVPAVPVVRKSKADNATGRQLIEITDQVLLPGLPLTLHLSATFDPPTADIPRDFPVWLLDGVEVGRGKSVEFPVPHYSGLVGTTVPSLVNGFGAQSHRVVAEGVRLDVNVYPDIKGETKVDLGKFLIKIGAAIKTLEDAVDEVSVGPVTGKFETFLPETVTFSFANQWKECDDLANANAHKVFWTYDAETGFDPLFGVSGRVNIGVKVPVLARAVFFTEAYGQLTLKGKLSRDQTGTPSGTATLGGKLGIKAGIDVNLTVFSATFEADAPVSVSATVTASAQNISSSLAANFDGLVGKATIKAAGGIFEFSDEITLVTGKPLIQPVTEILKSF